jgi:hypothetical protein
MTRAAILSRRLRKRWHRNARMTAAIEFADAGWCLPRDRARLYGLHFRQLRDTSGFHYGILAANVGLVLASILALIVSGDRNYLVPIIASSSVIVTSYTTLRRK